MRNMLVLRHVYVGMMIFIVFVGKIGSRCYCSKNRENRTQVHKTALEQVARATDRMSYIGVGWIRRDET